MNNRHFAVAEGKEEAMSHLVNHHRRAWYVLQSASSCMPSVDKYSTDRRHGENQIRRLMRAAAASLLLAKWHKMRVSMKRLGGARRRGGSISHASKCARFGAGRRRFLPGSEMAPQKIRPIGAHNVRQLPENI